MQSVKCKVQSVESKVSSPIDTAMSQENQRIETGHVGPSKRAFRERRPQHFVASKSSFSYEFSHEPQIASEIDVSCGASVNFQHGICTLSPLHTALTM